MRLWIWSDTHGELQHPAYPERAPAGVDVLVIAGDLAHAEEVEFVLENLAGRYGIPIVFVPGNHEFYVDDHRSGMDRGIGRDRRRMSRISEASRAWTAPVYVLDDNAAVIGGVRFLGGTLWTDFGFDGIAEDEEPLPYDIIVHENMRLAPRTMSDYAAIPRLDAATVLQMHETTRDYLRADLARPHDGPTVVVTHHVPHPIAQPEAYRHSGGNGFFACSERPFGDLLASGHGPDLWVYGHSHHSHRARLGRTDFVINPLGYLARRDERENGFRWDVTADV